MTPKKAVKIFIKEYPSLKIVSLKDYHTDYLITAYNSLYEMDPFHLEGLSYCVSNHCI